MRDYFGEYMRSMGARPASRRLGEEVTSATLVYQAPLKVHLLWLLALIISCLITWKAGRMHVKLSEAVKAYKGIASRKRKT